MKTIKDLLAIAKHHQKIDLFIQGEWLKSDETVGDLHRGCMYGCIAQSNDDPIDSVCEEYNLPLWIGYWSERVFEGLPKTKAVLFPVQLFKALSEFKGDTDKLKHDLAIKRLSFLLPTGNVEVDDAIDQVIDYHQNPAEEKRRAAESTAYSAAYSTVYTAAYSAARSAAYSPTWSVALSAKLSAISSTAESAAWQRERDWMLELLEAGK